MTKHPPAWLADDIRDAWRVTPQTHQQVTAFTAAWRSFSKDPRVLAIMAVPKHQVTASEIEPLNALAREHMGHDVLEPDHE